MSKHDPKVTCGRRLRTQLAVMLGVGITATAVEKWEKNQNRPTNEHKNQIVQFLGFEPATTNPTGGS
jgi:transcriptional regulator with XRE-family HTH domain